MESTLLIIPREDVESLNLAPFLRRFGTDKLPRGQRLGSMMGTLTFSMIGYEDVKDELYSIQPARDFYKELLKAWPYWFFFCDLGNEGLMTMTLCVLESIVAAKRDGEAYGYVRYSPPELAAFMRSGFVGMNAMCEQAGLSEPQIARRSEQVTGYYEGTA